MVTNRFWTIPSWKKDLTHHFSKEKRITNHSKIFINAKYLKIRNFWPTALFLKTKISLESLKIPLFIFLGPIFNVSFPLRPNLQKPFLLTMNVQKRFIVSIVRFLCSNHSLPVEQGRWNGINHNERICTKCDTGDIGDEFHCLLTCPYLQH